MTLDADADTGLLGNLSHGGVHSRSREYRLCRFEQRAQVALRVGTHAPICADSSFYTITGIFQLNAHDTPT